MIARLESLLSAILPRYYLRHAAIAVVLSMLAGAIWYAGLAWAWQINVVLLVAGAIVRDIEKEDTLHPPAWWWVLVPLVVAGTSMAIGSAWAFGGAWFYTGRELRDRERLGTWDHPGYRWPWCACALLWLVAVLINTAATLI